MPEGGSIRTRTSRTNDLLLLYVIRSPPLWSNPLKTSLAPGNKATESLARAHLRGPRMLIVPRLIREKLSDVVELKMFGADAQGDDGVYVPPAQLLKDVCTARLAAVQS